MQQAFLSRVEEVLSRVEEVCGLRMHGGHRRRSIYYVCEEYRRPADLRLQDHPRTVYLREDVAVSKVVEFLQTHVFGPQRRELLRRALEASDPEAEERGDEIERLRRLVDELSLRIRRQMANLEIEEPGSEAAGEIRARLRELAAMKARRQRELEAAERAVTGQPDPDTATTLLDRLQVSAELLREESCWRRSISMRASTPSARLSGSAWCCTRICSPHPSARKRHPFCQCPRQESNLRHTV